MTEGTYRAPDVPSERLTPRVVRDELLRCFESANREFFKILEQPMGDEALRQQVHQFVTGVFQECGASYENPTKEGIVEAIEQCKTNAEQMMGEKGTGIIRHHYQEMAKLVARLPD